MFARGRSCWSALAVAGALALGLGGCGGGSSKFQCIPCSAESVCVAPAQCVEGLCIAPGQDRNRCPPQASAGASVGSASTGASSGGSGTSTTSSSASATASSSSSSATSSSSSSTASSSSGSGSTGTSSSASSSASSSSSGGTTATPCYLSDPDAGPPLDQICGVMHQGLANALQSVVFTCGGDPSDLPHLNVQTEMAVVALQNSQISGAGGADPFSDLQGTPQFGGGYFSEVPVGPILQILGCDADAGPIPGLGTTPTGMLGLTAQQLQDSVARGALCYDPAAAARCMAHGQQVLLGVDAGISSGDASCRGIFVPNVGLGGACSRGVECQSHLYCRPTDADVSCGGTCQYFQTVGQVCNEQVLCDPYSYCDAAPDGGLVCMPRSVQGGVCAGYNACQPGLICNSSTNRCASFGELGDRCDDGTVCDPFASGLFCVGGVCQLQGNLGGACSPLADPLDPTSSEGPLASCAGCALCINATALDGGDDGDGGTLDGGLVGTCATYIQDFAPCTSDTGCKPFSFCGPSQICVPRPREGQACTSTASSLDQGNCLWNDDVCARPDGGASGTCVSEYAAHLAPCGSCAGTALPCSCFDDHDTCAVLGDGGMACVGPAAAGEACMNVACAAGLACSSVWGDGGAISDGGGFVCVAPGAAGAPCAVLPCEADALCATTDADGGALPEPVCVAAPPVGQPCLTGRCGPGLTCDATGNCTDGLPLGASCSSDTDCDSGFCGDYSHRCIRDYCGSDLPMAPLASAQLSGCGACRPGQGAAGAENLIFFGMAVVVLGRKRRS
ncbi:MAG: hypothetical protein JST54_28020 [Deltaproteobacteria bacterium]|nr:hypothetical protein [Deltaproteobacteria bacterium]